MEKQQATEKAIDTYMPDHRLECVLSPKWVRVYFGGETIAEDFIAEKCSLCGECIVELTGGFCPITLCSKGLLNGPCGGAQQGKCEVDPDRDCGWTLIYERLKKLGKLENLYEYREPKNYAKWNRPRSLANINVAPTFRFGKDEYSP